jgi:hypothetical protein
MTYKVGTRLKFTKVIFCSGGKYSTRTIAQKVG